MSCRFGADLTVEVYLNAAVYGNEVRNASDYAYVVYVVDWGAAAYRVIVDKVVELFCSSRKGVHRLAFVDRLVSRQLSSFKEVGVRIDKHFRMGVYVSHVGLGQQLSYI